MTLGLVAALGAVLLLLVYGLWSFQRLLHRYRQGLLPGEPAAVAAAPTAASAMARRADLAWLAVRCRDASELLQALGSGHAQPGELRKLLPLAQARGLLVLPPVDGWVFACGRDLWPPPGAEEEFLGALLLGLSRQFGCAQWFLAADEADHFGWAVAFAGELQRAYADGAANELPCSVGEPTQAELRAGCFVADPRDCSGDGWWPDRQAVRAVAAAWSRDPWRLLAQQGDGQAWFGRWRP